MSTNTLPDIRQTQVLNAPIEKVWKAVSTPEGFAAWFMPGEIQPVVGHEFLLEAGPFGKSPMKVTESDPPRRISMTWGKDWTLTFELSEQGDKRTEITVIHGGWDADKVTEFGQPHAQVREIMNEGWAKMAHSEKLARFVEG